MLFEPTLMCRALVGLADVEIVGVISWTAPMQVHIASTLCGHRVRSAAARQGSSRRCAAGSWTCRRSAAP